MTFNGCQMTKEFREWFRRVIEANANQEDQRYDWMGLEDDIWDKVQEAEARGRRQGLEEVADIFESERCIDHESEQCVGGRIRAFMSSTAGEQEK